MTSGQKRWRVSPLMLSVFVCATAFAPAVVAAQQATTVILVRHAEKAVTPANDPGLTEAGAARARALMAIARDAGVTAVITTQFARTRETARPAAEALRITPEVARTGGSMAQHAQDVARMVQTHAGGVVLVVGHSNTIPAIVSALGAPQPPPICDSEYDDLYVVTLAPNAPAHVIRARYGAPSPAEAGCGAMKP
jgi:phosphohistidine phosphatase SixA